MTPSPEELPLRDIHLPPPVAWWPPAPAWWYLLAVALLSVLFGLWLWRRHRARRAYRGAMAELADIRSRFDADADKASCAQALSRLLRRIVLHEDGGQPAASTDENWLKHLETRNGEPLSEELQLLFTRAAYSDRIAVELPETAFETAFDRIRQICLPRRTGARR